MLEISKPEKLLFKILGKQTIKEKKYRPFFFIHSVEYDDGLILANIFTKEKIWLSSDEKDFLKETDDIANKTVQILIDKWFLVPIDLDDDKLVKNTVELKKMFTPAYKDELLNNFTIYTTTDCNARCFYCYEHGCRKISMSAQTANDVADFIIKKSKGQSVTIRWFGGEPLYNVAPIDIICEKLTRNNVEYKCNMISNAYLFDDELIKKAKEKWNLKGVQITLDGTEKIYNKIKAYIYKEDISPFIRVINNIDALLKTGIPVNIRLNFNEGNIEDIKCLLPWLIEKYKKYPLCRIYTVALNDYINPEISDIEKYRYLCETQIEMMGMIYNAGMNEPKSLIEERVNDTHCMADNDHSTTILPDGKLGKCEHYLNDNFWGDIYSDEVDYEMINSFKVLKKPLSECANCKWKLLCGSLEKCEALKNYCNDYEKSRKEYLINLSLKKEYNAILKENTNEVKV